MSKDKDCFKEFDSKTKQEKKKKKRQQHLQEAENDAFNYFEENAKKKKKNKTANEEDTAMEISEIDTPLLELDDNAENHYKSKDRVHKKKKRKDKIGDIIENSMNKEHSRNKRKHHLTEEQAECYEVTENEDEDRRKRKKQKKERRLKEAEDNCNNEIIILAPKTTEQAQKSQAEDISDYNSEATKDKKISRVNLYWQKIKQDPVKKEKYLRGCRERYRRLKQKQKEMKNNMEEGENAKIVKRYKEIRRRGNIRTKLIREGKIVEEDPTKAEANLAKIRKYEEKQKRKREREEAKMLKIMKKNELKKTKKTVDASRKRKRNVENDIANETKHVNVANCSQINKLPEPRKPKSTIADFTIDSTESLATLLDYFERKNKPVVFLYKKLMAKYRLLTKVQHFLMPGLPLNTFADGFNGCLPSRYYAKFAYKCTMPTITTRLKNLEFTDPVTKIISLKTEWKTDVYIGLKTIGSHLELTKKRNDKVYTTTEHVIKMMVLMDQDPDPNFDESYNWYYAGNGNLQVISVNEADCLLHSQLTRLFLSKFSRRKLLTRNKPLISFDCGENNYIFETICNPNNFVVLRLQHKIHILKLTTEEGSLQFKPIKEIDSKIPFTSIQFDNYQKNVLYITKLDGTLCIVNLNLMKARTLELMKGASMKNNWNKVVTVDQLSYCHVSRTCLRIFDKRTNNIVYEFSDLQTKHSERYCDEITAIMKCEDVPFVYLATSHYMFLMDLRWQGDNKPRLLRRWTHHMENIPAYISLIKHDINKDFVCLSSQWAEDSCLITNDTEIFDGFELPTSITLPYGLPTFDTTLNAAKGRMLCVDIYNPIEQRLYTSVTGNCLMSADDNIIILTLNSLGDIFAYTLYPEHLEKDDDSLERLHEWGSTMTREKIVYESCSVIDIAHIWRSLKKVPEEQVLGDFKLLQTRKLKFSEQAVHDILESGEIDNALTDAWFDDEKEQSKVKERALNIDLHFSDSE